jgi:hypothetical protein
LAQLFMRMRADADVGRSTAFGLHESSIIASSKMPPYADARDIMRIISRIWTDLTVYSLEIARRVGWRSAKEMPAVWSGGVGRGSSWEILQ